MWGIIVYNDEMCFFEKNLEKLDLDAVNTYSESLNSSGANLVEGEL